MVLLGSCAVCGCMSTILINGNTCELVSFKWKLFVIAPPENEKNNIYPFTQLYVGESRARKITRACTRTIAQ